MYEEIEKLPMREKISALWNVPSEDVFADVKSGKMSFEIFELWIQARESGALELQYL